MEFAQPDRVEPDFVAEVDLGQDVVVALLLRKAGGAGQLVEKSEAHASSRGPIFSSAGIACDPSGQQGRPIRPLGDYQPLVTYWGYSPRDC
jgi:hypothetical protein